MASGYEALVLANKPVLYVPGGEVSGSIAEDRSRTLDCTFNESPRRGMPGPPGLGLGFDPLGSGSNRVSRAYTTLYSTTSTAMSWEAWVLLKDPISAGGNTVFNKGSNSAAFSNRSWDVLIDTNAKLTFWFFQTTIRYIYTSNRALTIGRWHHIAVTFGNGVVSLYIDGQLDGPPVTRAGQPNGGSSLPIYIGFRSGTTSCTFNGTICQVAYYLHTRLSSAEIGKRWAYSRSLTTTAL